ncbi:MAG: glycosyltransferase [Rikenellaceae bacterium]
MKVINSGTIDINAGGVATGIYYTMLGLRGQGVDADIFMYKTGSDAELVGENVSVFYTQKPTINKIAYSSKYKADLQSIGVYDIYHAQGIWQYPTYAMIDVAKKFSRPYLISPHGMLYPQDIAKSSSLFKKLSLKARLLSYFNGAACVHATCQQELDHCRNLAIKSPIAIISNPVEIVDYIEKKEDNIFRVGYLGRISPRKNVESLIYAFADLKDKIAGAELLIIGGGDDEYEKFLRLEVKRLNLSDRVSFTGFLSGQEKNRAIASLSLLVMPSEFENHGIVVLEALVRKIPVIATKGSPWQELHTYGCGWWVDYNQNAITEAIEAAFNTPLSELEAMGQRGRELMEQNYSVEAVGTKMKALYEWILTKRDKPEFVYE